MNTFDKNTLNLLTDLSSEIASKTNCLSDDVFLCFIGCLMDEREYFDSLLPFKDPFETVPALEKLLEISKLVHKNM